MKRFISILLALVFVLSVMAFAVSCGESKETTTNATTVETTNVITTEKDTTQTTLVTTTEEVTTKETTVQTTTEETTVQTTTEETTVQTTTETTTTETTTEATTTESTIDESLSLSIALSEYLSTTETQPIYARFDFGTQSLGQAKGYTSHEYLVAALTYDESCISVEYKYDSIVITALKSSSTAGAAQWTNAEFKNYRFALAYNDIVDKDLDFDFEDSLRVGYGTWKNYPFSTAQVDKIGGWSGAGHQFMKIRLINHSKNNMIGLRFRRTSDGNYFTTTVASNMYLQGGEGVNTTTAVDTWATYTYDMAFCSTLASGKSGDNTTYESAKAFIYAGNAPGNNWTWGGGQEVISLEFNLLGAASSFNTGATDTRGNILKQSWVEVDYIVFGATPEQLEGYKSNMELGIEETTSETTPEETTTETTETTPTETTTETTETTPIETTTETTPLETTEKVLESEFNENKIVFAFGALSDVHIESKTGAVAEKFKEALLQLELRADADCPNGLGGVFIAGDLVQSAYSGEQYYVEMSYFKSLYELMLDPEKVPMIYAVGNHDVYPEWSSQTVAQQKKLNAYLDEKYFLTDVDLKALDELGCRHCIVSGYHILTINPISKSPVNYAEKAKEWLDKTLNEITTENPNQYVIVLTHPMIYDTVYGSTLGDYWYTKDLTTILSKYPQVITFSGHLHFPLNDPRSIMQDTFTSLGCGSGRYMAIEDAGYMDMAGSTTMKDKDLFSQGLLVEIDESGNVRFVRMDFYHDEIIGDYWEISYPQSNGEHLTKYTKARGNDETNSGPTLSTLDIVIKTAGSGKQKILVQFAKGEDDEFVHDYVVKLYKDGNLKKTYKILADFYLHGSPSDMKQEWEIDCGAQSQGTYEVEVVAYDSWGKASEPLKKTIVLDGTGEVTKPENAPLSVYADFDFVNGNVVETKGNVKITMHGATVGQTKVNLDGKEYTVEALNTSKDKYVICKFNKLAKQEDVKKFAESGFSVEAFYYAENNGAIQGVVCGTQDGGWGLAITKDYKPYFITGYDTKKYNPSVTSPTVSSSTDLVHVVAVYNIETLTSSIYVNGVLKDTKTIDEKFCVGNGVTYNMFCLGADVTVDGLGNDFPTKNLTMLDAKIYTGVLAQSDVDAAYAAALSLLK